MEVVINRESGCATGDMIDLELIKRVNADIPKPGDTILFQLTVFNNSEVDATGVTLEDYLPNGFEVVEGQMGNGGFMVDNRTVRWANFDVDALSLYRVSFKATVNMPGDGIDDFRNVAQITAADQQDFDSTPGNDDGDQSEDDEDFATAMPSMTDVSITKSVSDINPDIRDVITYTIRVTNEGC